MIYQAGSAGIKDRIITAVMHHKILNTCRSIPLAAVSWQNPRSPVRLTTCKWSDGQLLTAYPCTPMQPSGIGSGRCNVLYVTLP